MSPDIHNKKRCLFICHTLFHILISSEKCLVENRNADILLSDTLPEYKIAINRIADAGIFKEVDYFEEVKMLKTYFEDARLRHKYKIRWIFKNYFKEMLLEKFAKYDDIYIFNDMYLCGIYLQVCNIKYHLIEDGMDVLEAFSIRKKYHKKIFDSNRRKWAAKVLINQESIYFCDSKPKCIIDLEVNNLNTVPEWLKVPVVQRNRHDLKEQLTIADKKAIVSCFLESDKYNNIINLNKIQEPKALLLTQPFGEESWCDNDKLVEYYNNLIEDLTKKYLLYIKLHPRDKNTYSTNDKVCILGRDYPIEILNFSGNLQFDIAVTVSSTSINMLDDVDEKIILGEENLRSTMANKMY